jgi:hypothetical protein
MLTITLSDTEGHTITTHDAADLERFALRHGSTLDSDRLPELAMLLYIAASERPSLAGSAANALGLNFSFSYQPVPARETYLVPVDPADATQCESCQ